MGSAISICIDEWREAIRDYAHRCLAGYRANKKPRSQEMAIRMSLRFGAPRADLNPKIQMIGRAGEVAYCLAYGLDPLAALDWSDTCDDGKDLVRDGRTWDVKSTERGRRFLIWPVEKIRFYEAGCADMLVLALVGKVRGKSRVDLVGEITKQRFLEQHEIAERGNEYRLYPGTWFMFRNRLDPMQNSRPARLRYMLDPGDETWRDAWEEAKRLGRVTIGGASIGGKADAGATLPGSHEAAQDTGGVAGGNGAMEGRPRSSAVEIAHGAGGDGGGS